MPGDSDAGRDRTVRRSEADKRTGFVWCTTTADDGSTESGFEWGGAVADDRAPDATTESETADRPALDPTLVTTTRGAGVDDEAVARLAAVRQHQRRREARQHWKDTSEST